MDGWMLVLLVPPLRRASAGLSGSWEIRCRTGVKPRAAVRARGCARGPVDLRRRGLLSAEFAHVIILTVQNVTKLHKDVKSKPSAILITIKESGP